MLNVAYVMTQSACIIGLCRNVTYPGYSMPPLYISVRIMKYYRVGYRLT